LEVNKKILIVDDEVAIRRVVELKLKKRGFQVVGASNGAEGLRKIQEEKPDAVITDINMPCLNGRSLCERSDPLKEERRFLTIVLTAGISPDEKQWIEKMKDTEFMQKPFSPSKLVERIELYFRH
jgi:DNA-binding response OmpR family regulator